jgi:hypothetical protein
MTREMTVYLRATSVHLNCPKSEPANGCRIYRNHNLVLVLQYRRPIPASVSFIGTFADRMMETAGADQRHSMPLILLETSKVSASTSAPKLFRSLSGSSSSRSAHGVNSQP